MNPDRLGTAQWADPEEVATRYAFREGAVWLGRTMPRKTPIGVNDDRHVCLVAGTRSGKGTSVIIPNLCTWPGSVVVIDPTGDNATLTVPRRGNGNDRTVGMRQHVQVLDPYGISKVEDRYRAQFNPLDMLDLNSRHVVRDAEGIAASLVPPSQEEEVWALNGARRLIAGLILYVLSEEHFKDRRNLVTVRDLLYRGDVVELDNQRQRGAPSHLTAFDVLWLGMRVSPGFNGQIAGVGEQFAAMTRQAPAQWTGVHDVALSATNFINNEDMRYSLSCSTFSIRDLKANPKGLSLYLTVPSKTKVEDFRWLRMIVSLVMGEMESVTRPPATGHPTLMILDEFAGLQKMDRLESGISEIAKYGVKLFLVLQSLPQLKNVYGDNWETFIANCGTKIFFGIEDHFTRDYVSRLIGDTEVIRVTEAETEGHNTNQTRTNTTSRSQTAQQSDGWSKDDSYKRMVFGLRDTASMFRKLAGSTMASDSRQGSTTSGNSTEEGSAQAESSGREQASTRTQNIHKRPLVTPDEVGKLFRRIEAGEQSALYPGMAIALLSSHPDPLLVRRTNYFEDEFFDRCGFEIRRVETKKTSIVREEAHATAFPEPEIILTHGICHAGHTVFKSHTGAIVCRDEKQAVLIDPTSRSFSAIPLADHQRTFAGISSGQNGEVLLFAIESRERHSTGVRSFMQRVYAPTALTRQCFLKTYVFKNGYTVDGPSVLLEGRRNVPLEVDSSLQVVDLGHDRVALLISGYLALYDTHSHSLICGPIDISGPSDQDFASGTPGWVRYIRLFASADGTRLFVRGRGKLIRVYSATNLTMLSEIAGIWDHSETFLLPWSDPRYILFTGSDRIRTKSEFKTEEIQRVLRIADTSSGKVLRQIVDSNNIWVNDSLYEAVLLGSGSRLAVWKGVVDLVTGEFLNAPWSKYPADTIHLSPGCRSLITIPGDGTVLFWSLGVHAQDSPERARAVLRGA